MRVVPSTAFQSVDATHNPEFACVVVNVALFDVVPTVGAPTAPNPSESRNTQTTCPQKFAAPNGRTHDTLYDWVDAAVAVHAIARAVLTLVPRFSTCVYVSLPPVGAVLTAPDCVFSARDMTTMRSPAVTEIATVFGVVDELNADEPNDTNVGAATGYPAGLDCLVANFDNVRFSRSLIVS